VDVGRVAPGGGCDRRHPLFHEVEQARHEVERRLDTLPERGGPARRLVPHLYFWKSAQCVRGLALAPRDEPGVWIAAYIAARRPKATALGTDSDARDWRNAARGQANEW
jgi:DMSO/TMAO reductase YedYZ molybdopterin-dependent catalytic subunit